MDQIILEFTPFVHSISPLPPSTISLTTLELQHVQIHLSDAGFTLLGTSPPSTFESMQALLSSVSPLYRLSFSEALARKLEEVEVSE
jgi:hypothetical protein